jgi:hypothetical protein
MISAIGAKIKSKNVPNDIYYTPVELVRQHIELIPKEYHKECYKWLDPFYGSGLYYNHYPHSNKDYTEIEIEKDFFDYKERVDVICSNPPFSLMNRVLEHSISLEPRVISYIMEIINLEPKRIKQMNDAGYGLTYIKVFRVRNWFASTIIAIFEKDKSNIIDIETTSYKVEKSE